MRESHLVAVIGAGPAGLFGARELANQGAHVVLLNRDIKPGGLAEYGIYPSKHTMKAGLRKQFRQVLEHPNIDYYGNITIGTGGDLNLDDLWTLGFQAVLVTAGAQGAKWLGLPGEDPRREDLLDLAARTKNRIPADVADTIREQPGIPVLIRTVGSKHLGEDEIRELTEYIREFY